MGWYKQAAVFGYTRGMFQFGLGLEKGYTGFAKKSEAMLP
jgi:hypothetical protein